MTALEIGHVIADRTQKPPRVRRGHLDSGARPGDARLLLGAVGEWVARPGAQLAAVRRRVTEVATNSGQLLEVGRRFADVARTFARGTAPPAR